MHSLATRGLLAMDLVLLSNGQVTRMTLELVAPSELIHLTNGRTLELSTDLTCIAPLHGGSSVVLESNSLHSSHESVTLTTRLTLSLVQEAARAAGLFKYEDFIIEVSDDAASAMSLNEDVRQERILR
ncbi:hypothetical protein TNCV_4695411 [Trichonephila clavipes]|nr:hypothetical protein TNCV_4695411 [Trichonephila clavipes]